MSGHEHSRPSSRPSRTPRPALAAAAILVLEARRKPVRALRVRATVLEVDGAETARDRRRPGWLGPRLETSRPEAESKARVPRHAGRRGLAIVKRALAPARPWCPQLFHGRDCAPGRIRKRSTRYACLGYLRLAFQKACEAAGLVVGRKYGATARGTAATDLAAAGCTIEDVMKVGGWKTADVARRYDLGTRRGLRAHRSPHARHRCAPGGQAEGAGFEPVRTRSSTIRAPLRVETLQRRW